MASLAITAFVLFVLGGWRYYWSPLDVRAYTDLHPLLRPSGTVGNLLGITGLSLMVMMHLYTLRKKLRWMNRLGSVTTWLEFHIFCGFLGPVLITLHTSFKFNGVVSVAYWSMLVVLLSGFVGRYLYVRIPRSIRGRELSDAELATRAAELKLRLGLADLPATIASKVHAFESTAIPASEAEATWTGLVIGELRVKLRLYSLARLARDHENSSLIAENLALIAERAVLMRRIAYLKKTRRLFDLWRVYHKPLAILMVLIVVLHVGTAAYLGYGWALR
jgi:predicted ferric reductase